MKRNLSKFITIAIVLLISVINPIDAFAYFGPSINQVGASSFVGQVLVPIDIPANVENKLIITLPNADLSSASAAVLTDGVNPLLVNDVIVDDTTKSVTYIFSDYIFEGMMLEFVVNNVYSAAGTHPYKIEVYKAETGTTIEIESGSYTILDGSLLVNVTVGEYLNFGLNTDILDLNLSFIGQRAEVQRDISWNVSTNAQEYAVSARLKTPFTNGTREFPYYIPDGINKYIAQENMRYVTGAFIGNSDPYATRFNPMLINHFVPLYTTENVLLTTGQGTDGDTDSARLCFVADGKTPAGTYSGVIEFTITATF